MVRKMKTWFLIIEENENTSATFLQQHYDKFYTSATFLQQHYDKFYNTFLSNEKFYSTF